jgi:hypothetical protein
MGIVQKAGDLASDLSGDRRAPVAIAVDQRGGGAHWQAYC